MYLSVLFFFVSLIEFSSSKLQHPVVFVPGDGGTQLFGKLNRTWVPHYLCEKKTSTYESLWLNLELLIPTVVDCFVENMRLVYDRETHTTSNSPGVDIKIQDFGRTDSIEFLDPSHFLGTTYFYYLVNDLVIQGGERGKSVRGAPFDFRKSANELEDFFEDLQLLIEETYDLNNRTRVVLACHSMGNLVTQYFLNHMPQNWKDKYIKSWILLSAPLAGAVKTLRVTASGDNLNLFVVDPYRLRRQQRSMTSTAWMYPNVNYWGSNEVLVSRPGRNYSSSDYEAFFHDLNYTDGFQIWRDTRDLIHDLKPPNVEVHCVHGIHVDTPESFSYTKAQWPDYLPEVVYGNGDGTVNIRSLYACPNWKKQQRQAVYHHEIEGAGHVSILKDIEAINYVRTVVMDPTP